MSANLVHPRQVIRDRVFEILKSTVKGAKSFSKNRFRPLWEAEELPAIGVYTLQETSTIYQVAPRNLKRLMTLAIEIVAHDDETLNEVLDQLSLEVENALHVDETLRGSASDCRLESTDLIQKPEGEILVGSAILSFEVTYYTDAPEEQYLRPYKGADFVLKVGDADAPTIEGVADVEE